MPYPIPIGGIAEVTIPYHVNGQRCMSVHHYKLTAGSVTDGGANLGLLLDGINSGPTLLGRIKEVQSNAALYENLRAQFVYPLRFTPVEKTPYVIQGAVALPANYQQASVAITRRSDVATRHSISTFHLGAMPSDMASDGVLEPAYYTRLENLCNSLVATVSTGGGPIWTPVIYNRANPPISLVIVQASYQQTIRTMARRVVGRGI